MAKHTISIKVYFILIFVLFLFHSNFDLNAQYLINGANKIHYENDSVILHVDNVRGSVQWQVSGDKLLWQDIAGETEVSLTMHIDSSAFYRAKITDGTCNPIYSDTVMVAQVYDNRDNQVYNAVRIGYQWWMAENLNFRITGNSWYYNNDSSIYANKYGRLYNWTGANASCPSDWHLPSDLEWIILEMKLGMNKLQADSIQWRGTDEGTKLKQQGTFNFNASLGGFRLAYQTFGYIESSGTFWTSTEYDENTAWYRGIGSEPKVHRLNYGKDLGFSVRCVRNSPPIVYSNTVTNLTTYAGTANGEIIVDGGAIVTARGFCWSTSPSPDVNNSHVSLSGSIGTFASMFSGLSKNTTYYLRAFASNSFGTYYGDNITFKTPLNSVPTVFTDKASSITMNSALIGGSVLDDGGSAIKSKGLCWDSLPSPDFSSVVISKGTGTAGFTSTLSGLKINHEYHVRAYAVNNVDTAYGEEVVFETLPINPLDTIIDNRDGKSYEIVKIGYQWWLSDNLDYFTPGGSWYYDGDSASNSSTFGKLYNWETALNACPSGWHLPSDDEWKILESEVEMNSSVLENTDWRGTNQGDQLKKNGTSGLDILLGGFKDTNDQFLYLNSSGTYWTSTSYSTDNAWYRGFGTEPTIHRFNFDKDMAFSVRCVRDNTPIIEAHILKDSTTRNSAVIQSEIIYDGGDVVSSSGLCWSIMPNPDLLANRINSGSGLGIFNTKITGLVPNNTYYVRAFAINKFDTAYSDNISFISIGKPVISTSPIVNITTTSAASGGNITDDGGASILSRGVCWNILPNPTIKNSKTSNGASIGIYTSSLSGLSPNTEYYIRAYARTAYDTVYGMERSFITSPTSQEDSIKDTRDGKMYNIVKIGDQWWFAENLNFASANSWCYENNPAYCDTFGKLYTWNAALNSCPFGWHLPRDNEFKTLERYLGMDSIAAEQIEWRGTDEGTRLKIGSPIGFNIEFGGFRLENSTFNYVNSSATLWTSDETSATEAWYRGFGTTDQKIHRYYYVKDMGFSVRCIKTNSPQLLIDSVYNITKTSSKIDAKVLSDGGVNVTERGICYGLTHNPTILSGKFISGSGVGSFTVLLSGLTTNRTYYARAYAINNYDTAYSTEISFISITKPIVTTSSVSSLAKTTAFVGGNVTDDGGSTILERGVCYGITPHPVSTGSHLAIGTGTGSFSATLSGLNPNRTYYLRAYAMNVKGVSYGSEYTFKTLPFYLKGTLTDSRDSKIYSKIKIGEQWWFAENLNFASANSWCFENNTSNCDTLGRLYLYTASINVCPTHWHLPSDNEWKTMETELGIINPDNTGWRGIDQGTQLKDEGSSGFDVLMGGFRNTSGDFVEYGTSGTFWTSTSASTNDAWYRGFGLPDVGVHRDIFDKGYSFSVRCLKDTLPVVSTSTIGVVTDSSVVCGGEITYDGGKNVIARGICIAITSNPTIANDTTNNGIGIGAFVSYKKGLLPGTHYNVRAYATNSEGTSYGLQTSFTTATTKPKVITTVASSITDSSAHSGGNVTSTGGASVNARGICWSTSPNPLVETSDTTQTGTGPGVYTSTLKNLAPNTKYYYRAYATNSAGLTGYGLEYYFTTLIGYPKVTTSIITTITDSSATGGGNVTSTGGVPVMARGICWGLAANPTIINDSTNNGTGPGIFTSLMKNLQPNKTYFVRAYAINSKGPAYGNQVSFTTSAALPQVTTSGISAITFSTASGGGNVLSDGGSAIMARGVCWSTGITPTISNSKTTDGVGTGTFVSSITGLTRNTKYYVRAYATNSLNTAYGDTISFRTKAELPELTTTVISSLTDSSAISGGTITDNGGAPIVSKGVCWNTTGNPTITNDTTLNGSGSTTFISSLKGLISSTTYYVKAYAQNSAGYNYGNEIVFKTLNETDTLKDLRDNQKYLTVKIGTNWWMAQNLNYRDTGTVYYNNDSINNALKYGRLYTWTSMMKGSASNDLVPGTVQGVCPTGWHIPGNTEWNNLITSLGGSATAGSVLKETGNSNWTTLNTGATNETGFTARPGGIVNGSLVSGEIGSSAYYWTSTESNAINSFSKKLVNTNGTVTDTILPKNNHASVRCLKD